MFTVIRDDANALIALQDRISEGQELAAEMQEAQECVNEFSAALNKFLVSRCNRLQIDGKLLRQSSPHQYVKYDEDGVMCGCGLEIRIETEPWPSTEAKKDTKAEKYRQVSEHIGNMFAQIAVALSKVQQAIKDIDDKA